MKKQVASFLLIITIIVGIDTGPVFSYAQINENCHNNVNKAEDVLEIQNSDKSIGFDELDENEYDGFIYKLDEDVSNIDLRNMKKKINRLEESEEVTAITENVLYKADSLDTINTVISADDLEYVEPNYRYKLNVYSDEPNDLYYNRQEWAFNSMNVGYVWRHSLFGSYGKKRARVAVIDTGVSEHPDLMNVMKGTGFVNGEEIYNSDDIDFHGTFVSGIIGAENNNGVGITGLMPSAEIYPIKVFQKSKRDIFADTDDIILGINNAVNNGVDVINLSLGSEYKSRAMHNAVQNAVKNNIIVVAAAGNEGNEKYNYPAAFSEVVAVGAINESLSWERYSNRNDQVTVSAPGGNIISTCPLGIENLEVISTGYMQASGTSFSTPQVTALAAMAKTIKPDLTPEEFIRLLKLTSTDYGTVGYDTKYGWGVVNFGAVLGELETCADGHIFGKWEAAKKASFENDSKAVKICSECSLVETKILRKVKKVNLSKYRYTYNGKSHKPMVKTFVDNNGKIIENIDYYITYNNSGSKKIGSYKCIVTLTGNYVGCKKLTYTIIPNKVNLKTLFARKKSILVTWNRPKALERKQLDGYQIRYSRNKNFSSYKTIKVKNSATRIHTCRNLRSGKRYYVKIRAYKDSVYSNWSKIKSVKVR